MRRGRTFARPRRQRRPNEWEVVTFEQQFDVPTLAGDPASFELVSNAEIKDMSQPTLVRVRGEILIWLSDSVPGDGQTVALGIQVVPAFPATTGEGPITEGHSNRWLWHGFANLFHQPDPFLAGDGCIARLTVDSRGMRKVSEGDLVTLVFQSQIVSVGQDSDGGLTSVQGGLRLLFKD